MSHLALAERKLCYEALLEMMKKNGSSTTPYQEELLNHQTTLRWKDWKKPERKRKNLIRLGIDNGQAYAWSRTRMGGWAVAQRPILGTTITVARLMKRGYESMFSYYEKVSPDLN